MIDLQETLRIHELLLREFGGAAGVRDEGLLKAALARPASGFGEAEFYQTPEEKTGALLESIVKNHPFIDGNKRTDYVLMRLFLMRQARILGLRKTKSIILWSAWQRAILPSPTLWLGYGAK